MSEAERLHLPFAQGLLEFPADGPVCFFRASPNPDMKSELGERLICLQSLRTTFDQLVNGGYAVAEAAPENVSLAFVQLTRSRPENLGTIAAAFDKLKTGGILVVNGAKTDGVDSLLKAVRKVTPVDGVLSKAHGKVFWFTKTGDLPEFAEWEKAAGLAEIIPGFKTAPGMFSADKIDAGSARLAEHLSGELKGRVADLGAGWGWLAAQALSTPEITEIHLIEAEKTALDAARLNITDPRAQFFWQDVLAMPKPTEGYDRVISNPPFHAGRKADPEIGIGFIAAAAKLLKPSGKFLMVANRQLPYEAALERNFRHWKPLMQDNLYKVFLAQKPRVTR